MPYTAPDSEAEKILKRNQLSITKSNFRNNIMDT